MSTRLISILVLISLNCRASDSTLIIYGSVWKYLDDGSSAPAAWKDNAYDDALWASGNAPLGYGDGDEATVVGYGGNPTDKFITTYFRSSVAFSNISLFSSFTLNLKRDDGAVVYVNGNEVFRTNIPAGSVTSTTLAFPEAADDGNGIQTVTLAPEKFVNGTNLIAVEIHQMSNYSSDISFDLELKATYNSVPALVRQPYLQMASADAITIRWRTDVATMSRVCYGTSPSSLLNFVDDSVVTTEHEVRLTSLAAQTTYYYSVGSDADTLQGDSANFFETSPVTGTPKKTRMWIFGDSGVNTVEQNNVRDAFLNYTDSIPVDRMIMLGDNAYLSGTDAEYQSAVFSNHYEDILKHTPLWVAAGNHEMVASDATTQTGPYFDIFNLPTNAECGGLASGTETYYSFDYGNIHFICLETTTASFRAAGGAMLTWLAADLAATSQKWKIVYMHHPPYTKGGHDSDVETDLIEVRQNILPIIESYKVDLVLTGHNHQYERSFLLNGHYGYSGTLDTSMVIDNGSGTKPASYEKRSSRNYNGTVYVQAGTAGVLSGPLPGWPHPAIFQPISELGSLLLDLDADTLTVRYIDSDVLNPSVRDNFSIVKVCDIVASIGSVNDMCVTGLPVTLNGFPHNGIFSGNGISNAIFNPAVAGVGAHTITYLFTDSFGCSASASTIINVIGQVPAQPLAITAPVNVCPPVQGVQLYIAPVAGAANYLWSIVTGTTGVTLTGAVNDTSVMLNINPVAAAGYTLQVTANNVCGASVAQTVFLNRIREIHLPITGSAVACAAEVILYSSPSVHAFSTLTWTAPTGALINGLPTPQTFTGNPNVQVEFPAGFTYGKVCVTNHPACVSNVTIKCVAVSSKPTVPGAITGLKSVLAGTNGVAYSIQPVAGASGYNWTLPNNTTLASGQNTTTAVLNFSPSFTMGTLSVTALSNCSQSRPQSIFIKSYLPSPYTQSNFKSEGNERIGADYNMVSVSPNPAKEKLFLNFNMDADDNIEVNIYDLIGNIVMKQNVAAQKGTIQKEISIANLATGTYIIKFVGSSANQTVRFVKE